MRVCGLMAMLVLLGAFYSLARRWESGGVTDHEQVATKNI